MTIERPITNLVEGFLSADPTNPNDVANFAADAKDIFSKLDLSKYDELDSQKSAEIQRLIANIAKGADNQVLLAKAQSVVAQPPEAHKVDKSTPTLRK